MWHHYKQTEQRTLVVRSADKHSPSMLSVRANSGGANAATYGARDLSNASGNGSRVDGGNLWFRPWYTAEPCNAMGSVLPSLTAPFSTLPPTCRTLNWERSAVADCSRQRTLQPHWKHAGESGSAQWRDAEHAAAPHENRSTASTAHGTPWQTK